MQKYHQLLSVSVNEISGSPIIIGDSMHNLKVETHGQAQRLASEATLLDITPKWCMYYKRECIVTLVISLNVKLPRLVPIRKIQIGMETSRIHHLGFQMPNSCAHKYAEQ